jgi:hypothetical protein
MIEAFVDTVSVVVWAVLLTAVKVMLAAENPQEA